MYHSASTPEPLREEFIEIANTGDASVDVSGWKLDRGVRFSIPAGTVIPAGSFLVLAANRDALLAKSPDAADVIDGGWTGKLSNSGERLRLVDTAGETMDELEYADEGDWAQRRTGRSLSGTRGWVWDAPHDGGGFSLELIDGATRNDRGQNWRASAVQGGTPGMPNSNASDAIAPLISRVRHSPALPAPNQAVTISARAEGGSAGTLDLTARFRVARLSTASESTSGSRFDSAPMHDDGRHNDGAAGDGIFATILPPQPDRTIIEFYVEAVDGDLSRTWPGPSDDAGAQRANALYRVQAPVDRDSVHDAVFAVMTPDEDRTFRNIRRSSNALMNTTVIWVRKNAEPRVRYQCGVRVRGNSSRRKNPHPIRLTVPEDSPLDGRTEFNINSSRSYLQVLGMHLFTQAGLAAPDARPVEFFYNGANRANRGSPMFGHYVLMEPLGDEFLEDHLPDPSGNLYKKRSANPSRDRKRWGVHFESQVVYDQPGWHRADRWEKQTNVTADDWSDLQRFAEVMHAAPDATFLSEADEVINRSQWLRWFAMMTILNNRETNLSNGIDDDYSMYRGIDDPRFILLPHDLDSILSEGAGAAETIFPMIERVGGVSGADEIPQLVRYMRAPEIRAEYFGHLRELSGTIFTADRFAQTLELALGDWVSPGARRSIQRALDARRAFVLEAIAPQPLTAAWGGDEIGGFPATPESSIALSGRYEQNRQGRVTVAGREAELNAARGRWSIESVSLFPGINRIPVVAYDASGTETDSSFIDIWRTDRAGVPLPAAINADRTLAAEDGPYIASGEVTVASDVTLTIAPGTSVFFEPDARLIVAGVLVAEGTAARRIRFTSVPGVGEAPDIRPELPPGPPRWDGIRFDQSLSSSNVIRHADIEHAQDPEGAVHLARSEAWIDHCTFNGSRLRYVHAVSSSATISNCEFPDMFLPGERPHALRLDNVSEHIKATGAFPTGGHFIIRGNTFGTNAGHNDVIDVDSGKRPDESRQILQVLNNVFAGARDELLDLGGDAYIAGNFFANVFKDDQTSDRGYANAISTGDAAAGGSIVAARNVFWNVDHAINLKRGAGLVFENNTVADIHDDFVDGFGFTNVGSALNHYVDEPGGSPGQGSHASGNIFYNVPRVFGNVDLPDDKRSALAFDHNVVGPPADAAPLGDRTGPLLELGAGNVAITASVFNDADSGDFRLRPGSPAKGVAVLGMDAGAFVAPGIFITGEPAAVTDAASATLTVGGPGLFSYQFRVDDGAWSDELPIGNVVGFDRDGPGRRSAEITLSELAAGSHQIAVLGRDFAGEWQREPTLSRSWEIRDLGNRERVRLSEILAINETAYEIGGIFPDIIELRNVSSTTVDLSGMRLSDDPDKPAKFVFAPGTHIAAHGFLIVTAGATVNDAVPATDFGLTGGGDAVHLFAADGTAIDSVTFGAQTPDLSIGRRGDQWVINAPTPGEPNAPIPTASQDTARINEWLAGARDRFSSDYLELFNPSPFPIALEGMALTDDDAFEPGKFVFPPLSFLGPGGFLTLDQDQLNFALSRDSEEVALRSADGSLIDGVTILSAGGDVAFGRMPDGAVGIAALTLPTPGRPNIEATGEMIDLLAGLRITEILFSPSGGGAHEFVELRNIGGVALNLEGVRFTNGIDFTFGAEVLDAGEFIVLAQDAAAFVSRHGIGVRLAGAFSGRLNNAGETLELSLPAPNSAPIQRFRYEGDWFTETSGGRSLELIVDPAGATYLWSQRDAWLPSTNPLGSPGREGAPVVITSATSTFVDDIFLLPVAARNEVTSYRASGLPSGLVINRTTGLVSGQATEPGIFDVTITANGPGGQRSGQLVLHVGAFGPFHELIWGELAASYTVGGDAVPLALQAADAGGRSVETFADPVTVSATSLGIPQAYVVISELIDTPAKDGFELVNVSGRPIPTAAWKIAVNDPAHGAEAVHSFLQSFPEVLDADAIIVFDDVPDSGVYFGDDLPWDADKGWVLVSDGNGTVMDFAPWGYSAEELNGLQVTVDGVVHQPGLQWTKTGLAALNNGRAWHRLGSGNRFDPSQWAQGPPSPGSIPPLMSFPFADTIPYELRFGPALPFDAGNWSRAFAPTSQVYGLTITATAPGTEVRSQPFSVNSGAAPSFEVIRSRVSVERQPFRHSSRSNSAEEPILYTALGLPSGLTLDPSTGGISGVGPAAGTRTFSLIGQNLAGSTAIEIELLFLRDTDGDGAPDDWETTNGFDPEVADADGDSDSDGASNLNEYLSGTDPHDAQSVFRVTDIEFTAESGHVRIEWQSVPGLTYEIDHSADLRNWAPVPGPRVTAANTSAARQFFHSGTGRRHYRVRVAH